MGLPGLCAPAPGPRGKSGAGTLLPTLFRCCLPTTVPALRPPRGLQNPARGYGSPHEAHAHRERGNLPFPHHAGKRCHFCCCGVTEGHWGADGKRGDFGTGGGDDEVPRGSAVFQDGCAGARFSLRAAVHYRRDLRLFGTIADYSS